LHNRETQPFESTDIPLSVDLLAIFDANGCSQVLITDIAQRLRRHHDAQWQAEDCSRKEAKNDKALAAIKRQIDEMNIVRTRLVDEIDSWATEHIQQDPTAVLHTETLGSVIDRICIASVRAEHLRRGQNAVSRAHLAEQQLQELLAAYDQLVRDLVAGRRRVPGWQTLKSYDESIA
jgi:Protein of unknown function (DUF4254)